MKFAAMVFAIALAGCESLPIPVSGTDPPHPDAVADMSCMQDCLGSNASADFCHDRCAK